MKLKLYFLFLIFLCAFHSHAGIPGKAAIVIHEQTQRILYAEHADMPRHPASLTKKMTMYMLFEALQKKKITLNTSFRVSRLATSQAPSKLNATVGEYVTVATIIKALATKSANDMAVTAAEGLMGSVPAFVHAMNQKAKALGMRHTIFKNPSGLPNPHQWTTARDMSILGQALYHHFPQYWKFFRLKHFHHKGTMIKTHNHLLTNYPGSDGIKTGFVNASGFNISTSAVRYKPNGEPVRLFVVVMGGETRKARDLRVTRLLNQYFTKLGATQIKAPQAFIPDDFEKEPPVNATTQQDQDSNTQLDDTNESEETFSFDNIDIEEENALTSHRRINPLLLQTAQDPNEATALVQKMMLYGPSYASKQVLQSNTTKVPQLAKPLPKKNTSFIKKKRQKSKVKKINRKTKTKRVKLKK